MSKRIAAALIGAAIISLAAPADASATTVNQSFSGKFSFGSLSGSAFSGTLQYDSDFSPYYEENHVAFYYRSSGLGTLSFGQTTLNLVAATIYNDYDFGQYGTSDRAVFNTLENYPYNYISFGPGLDFLANTVLPNQNNLNGMKGTIAIGNSFGFFTLSQASAVPEPATWGMMIAGVGMAGATLRRRRKTAVALKLA